MDMVLIVLMNFEKHDINIQLTIAHDFAYKYKKNDTHNCKMQITVSISFCIMGHWHCLSPSTFVA